MWLGLCFDVSFHGDDLVVSPLWISKAPLELTPSPSGGGFPPKMHADSAYISLSLREREKSQKEKNVVCDSK